jgi:hypothetical protein
MINISVVNSDDYNCLIDFLVNFENEKRGPEFWRKRLNFWWDHNPAFSSKIERGWIIKDNQKIVGFLGIIPTEFQLSSKKILAFNSTTWRVLPKYRNRSLHLLIKQVEAAKKSILFNTTPNEVVAKILESMGFRKIPGPPIKRYILLINIRKIMKVKLNRIPFHIFFTDIFTIALKIYQFIRLTHRNANWVPDVRILDIADNKFDSLWEETRSFYENTNIRNSNTINWYCFGNLDFEKILFGCFYENELVAYAIFFVENEKDGLLKTLACADLWGYKINSRVIRSFISASKKFALDNNIDIVSFSIFNDNLNKQFQKTGLFRLSSLERYYLKTNTDKLGAMNGPKSYFSKFQGDYGL